MSFMQAEEQSYPWIKDLVHKLKWTYGALWTLNTTESSRPVIGFDSNVRSRVAEWKDGWYNSDLTRSSRSRTASANDDMVRDESRIEALFYSSYKSCSFQQGFGYVGLILLERQTIWLTGSQEVLDRAVHTQALFLKTARIQTVMCMPWNNHVLELGKFEQEARNEHVLHQIQRWLSFVMNPLLSTPQPSSGGLGVVSEDDSGGSREAMQMSPSIASSIFTDGSNVNVHLGRPSSSDPLIKQQQQRKSNRSTSSFSISGHRETSSSSDTRVPVQVPKRNIGFVRYPPAPPQSADDAVPLLRNNQEVLSQRVPSVTGNEKPIEIGSATSFAEDWGACAVAGRSGVFQHMVVRDSDAIVSCNGLTIAGTSSLLLADNFLHEHEHAHSRGGGGGISLDQALLTSLPMTMPPYIAGSLPLPMDLLQDSSATLFGLSPKNHREWPPLEPSKAQSLVQMLEDEYTDDDHLQRLHPPDHALIQSGVASSSETRGDWAGPSSVTATISHQHHHQYDHHTEQRHEQQQQPHAQQTLQQQSVQRQFEFARVQNPVVNNVQNMSTPRPALASLMTQQHQPHQQLHHQSQLVRIPHEAQQQPQGPRWPISFTTSTAWVRWVGRKQAAALRYNARDPSDASHAVRVNQMILKKLLTEMVPTIAEEQKAREQEAAGQTVETEISSHRAGMASYPTTTATRQESGGIQDPQARTHMLAERRRRVRENEHYAALRKLIPPTSRMDKATVLAETIQLVKRLRRRVRQLEKVNPDNNGTSNLPMVTSEDSKIGTTSPNSRGDPGSRTPGGASEPEEGKSSGPNPDFSVPASADPLQEDNKEVVDVNARACDENGLRAKIRTLHRPDTVIHILTCLKDLGLEVLSTNISIEKDWVHADFQLKINAVHSSRIPQFTEELQGALRKVVFAIKSSTNSTLEGRSLTQEKATA